MRKLQGYEAEQTPIYSILMMEKSGADSIIFENGKDSGYPDMGCTAEMGFYYDLQVAIDAMHGNICDIRECVYSYGFILRRLPGLYHSCGMDDRMYFAWDEEKSGFYEAEEPKLMEILAL